MFQAAGGPQYTSKPVALSNALNLTIVWPFPPQIEKNHHIFPVATCSDVYTSHSFLVIPVYYGSSQMLNTFADRFRFSLFQQTRCLCISARYGCSGLEKLRLYWLTWDPVSSDQLFYCLIPGSYGSRGLQEFHEMLKEADLCETVGQLFHLTSCSIVYSR